MVKRPGMSVILPEAMDSIIGGKDWSEVQRDGKMELEHQRLK